MMAMTMMVLAMATIAASMLIASSKSSSISKTVVIGEAKALTVREVAAAHLRWQ